MTWNDKDPYDGNKPLEQLSDTTIAEMEKRVLKQADHADMNSAMGGGHGDAGSRNRDLITMYMMGVRKEAPELFEDIISDIQKEADPEYSLYLQLKEKFE